MQKHSEGPQDGDAWFMAPSSLQKSNHQYGNEANVWRRATTTTTTYESVPLPSTQRMGALGDVLESLHGSIADIRRSQEAGQADLQAFIQQQLGDLKASLLKELKSHKDVTDHNHKDRMSRHHERMGEILDKINQAAEQAGMKKANASSQASQSVAQSVGLSTGSGATGSGVLRPISTRSVNLEKETLGVDGEQEEVEVPRLWKQFEKKMQESTNNEVYNGYMTAIAKNQHKQSFWHCVFTRLGILTVLPDKMPNTAMARATENGGFLLFQAVLIFANTCFLAFETDVEINAVLKVPREPVPDYLGDTDKIFNIIFAAELIFRVVALRAWFFVAPGDWIWNTFDTVLVVVSFMSDLLGTLNNMTFMRILRVIRVIRVARVIRMMRFFRHLRRMLFAILACLGSLVWAFVFLFMVVFMFGILFCQGVVVALEEEKEWGEAHDEAAQWFPSLAVAMLNLLAAATGGTDWLAVRKPLVLAGDFYGLAFVAYLMFIVCGVMNVLTGVFLSSADEFTDVSLIVQNEEAQIESFVERMYELFVRMDVHHRGAVDWPTFNEVLGQPEVRAFFSSLQLNPTHVKLIFDLLDEENHGELTLQDFVMGMIRLKGEAKAIDARVIQRQLSLFPTFFADALMESHAPQSAPQSAHSAATINPKRSDSDDSESGI